MKIKLNNLATGLLTFCVIYLFYLQFNTKEGKEVGFVRSQELVYQYDGMIDAMERFKHEQEEWSRNIDTLKSDYQSAVDNYNLQAGSMSPEQAAQQEGLLDHQYTNLMKYAQQMETSLNEREAEILEGVLNQINAFSEEFAKNEGLDLLITTAVSGTVLYGTEKMDYTAPLLTFLNKKYAGEG